VDWQQGRYHRPGSGRCEFAYHVTVRRAWRCLRPLQFIAKNAYANYTSPSMGGALALCK
jgi:hypothetical protein